jgi:hypothetical protein
MSERGAGLRGPELVSVACAWLHDTKSASLDMKSHER